MKYGLIIALSLASCGINMAYQERISEKYYLIATDIKEQLDISRKLESGDYIGRIPETVQRYAVVNDTLIFAQTTTGYYVLNTKRDHDFAEVKDVVIGPLDRDSFIRDWSSKYNIKFTTPK